MKALGDMAYDVSPLSSNVHGFQKKPAIAGVPPATR